MIGKIKLVCSAICIALLVGAGWAITSLSNASEITIASLAPEDQPLSGAELIEGYKSWTRVNPVPAIFHSQIAIQCAAPTAKQSKMEVGNPHRDKFITVFVNDIGKRAMMEERRPIFPLGSVIVKEKLSSRESSTPELLTVMNKRERGFNPENGDWEYMALDGSGSSVQARGRLESCQDCHMMVKATDYVSRNYLPYNIFEKLK